MADQQNQSSDEQKTTRTRQDAGRLGGLKTAKRHGADFYRKIGRAGGKARGIKKEDQEPAMNAA